MRVVFQLASFVNPLVVYRGRTRKWEWRDIGVAVAQVERYELLDKPRKIVVRRRHGHPRQKYASVYLNLEMPDDVYMPREQLRRLLDWAYNVLRETFKSKYGVYPDHDCCICVYKARMWRGEWHLIHILNYWPQSGRIEWIYPEKHFYGVLRRPRIRDPAKLALDRIQREYRKMTQKAKSSLVEKYLKAIGFKKM